jgi:hypothetical protein
LEVLEGRLTWTRWGWLVVVRAEPWLAAAGLACAPLANSIGATIIAKATNLRLIGTSGATSLD